MKKLVPHFVQADGIHNAREAIKMAMYENHPDLFFGYVRYSLNTSLSKLMSIINDIIKDATGESPSRRIQVSADKITILNVKPDEIPTLCVNIVCDGASFREVSSFDTYGFNVVCDDFSRGREIMKMIEERIGVDSLPSLNWVFKLPNGSNDDRNINLPKPKHEARDYYYPWIKQGVEQYQQDYLNSPSPILLLSGLPGTGKSSFLRDMIYKNKISCVMSYDEAVMSEDRFFIDFLTGEDSDMLIIEDADVLIMDRENNNNKVMSKILNSSDGLIKMDKKKIVFTTNLSDISKIDPALMRPGRCFDTVHFRHLTGIEAQNIASIDGLDAEFDENKSYSLAQVFGENTTSGSVHNTRPKKFGF